MACEQAASEVLLLFGPPFIGKTLYYWRHLSSTHTRLSPSELFRQEPNLGLRQLVITHVIPLLRKGKKVVIDDENWQASARNSIINLVKGKIPGCSFRLLSLVPKHGREQLYWSREWGLASPGGATTGGDETRQAKAEQRIDKWFEAVNAKHPVYGGPDFPQSDEHLTVQEHEIGLECPSDHQWEVPALFLEWAALNSSDKSHVDGAAEAISIWYRRNPCGRVIVIYDSKSQENASQDDLPSRQETLQEIADKVEKCPVYLLDIASKPVDSFLSPAEPGVIAYLQRLHNLSLRSPGTAYLYHTHQHMKAAQRAGLRYIKGRRVFARPAMMKSFTGTSQPEEAVMLKGMKLFPYPPGMVAETNTSLPLANEVLDGNCKVPSTHILDRMLYVYVKNKEAMAEYLGQYMQNASAVGDSVSRIHQMAQEAQSEAITQPTQKSRWSGSTGCSRISRRELPKWMLPLPQQTDAPCEGQGVKVTLEATLSTGSEGESRASLKRRGSSCMGTMYVLSEEELLDYAKTLIADQVMEAEEKADSPSDMLDEMDSSNFKNRNILKDKLVQEKPQPLVEPSHTIPISSSPSSSLTATKDINRKSRITQKPTENTHTEARAKGKPDLSIASPQPTAGESLLDTLFDAEPVVKKRKAPPFRRRERLRSTEDEDVKGTEYLTAKDPSHVLETVTTIPETAIQSTQAPKTRKSEKHVSKDSHKKDDFSVLDIFL